MKSPDRSARSGTKKAATPSVTRTTKKKERSILGIKPPKKTEGDSSTVKNSSTVKKTGGGGVSAVEPSPKRRVGKVKADPDETPSVAKKKRAAQGVKCEDKNESPSPVTELAKKKDRKGNAQNISVSETPSSNVTKKQKLEKMKAETKEIDETPKGGKKKAGEKAKAKREAAKTKSENTPKNAAGGKSGSYFKPDPELQLSDHWRPMRSHEIVFPNFPLIKREPVFRDKAENDDKEYELVKANMKSEDYMTKHKAKKRLRKMIQNMVDDSQVTYTEAEIKNNLKRDDAIMEARDVRDAAINEKYKKVMAEHDVKSKHEMIDGHYVFGPHPRPTRWTPKKILEAEARFARLPYLGGREKEWFRYIRTYGVFNVGNMQLARS